MVTKRTAGFTIVELLVIVVVIGILAAIIIVAYQGVTQRANDVTIQADMINNVKKLQIYLLDYDAYPTGTSTATLNAALTTAGLKFSQNAYVITPGSTNISYFNNNSGTDFALMVTSKSGKVFYYSSKDGLAKEYTNTAQPFPGSIAQIKTFLGMNAATNGTGISSSGVWSAWAK